MNLDLTKKLVLLWPFCFTAILTAMPARAGETRGGGIQTLHFSSEKPLTVGIGYRTATTLQFPEPISGLIGYGLTEGQEAGVYHYSHPPGSRFLSLRCLAEDQEADVTVMLGDEMIVLQLKPTPTPAVAVRLVRGEGALEEIRRAKPIDPDEVKERRLNFATDKLMNLLQLGKNERIFRRALPHLYEGVESRKDLDLRYDDGEVATVIRELHRFPDEDALMVLAEVENGREEAIVYDPGSFQVRVGPRLYPVTLADASGVVPGKGKEPIHVVIKGNPEGGRAHLSIKNDFRLVLSAYEPYQEPADELATWEEPVDGTLTEIEGDGLPRWSVVPPEPVIDPALFGIPDLTPGLLGYGKQGSAIAYPLPTPAANPFRDAWLGQGSDGLTISPNEGRAAK